MHKKNGGSLGAVGFLAGKQVLEVQDRGYRGDVGPGQRVWLESVGRSGRAWNQSRA